MNLELGIVKSCTADGCVVQLLDGRTISAGFSPRVRDNIRIRRRQVVAIHGESQPAIVWRWYRGEVVAVTPSGPAVRRDDQPAGTEAVLSNPGIEVTVGQEVLYCRSGEWQLSGKLEGDRPADPVRLVERYASAIAEVLPE